MQEAVRKQGRELNPPLPLTGVGGRLEVRKEAAYVSGRPPAGAVL